jgi:hypothetical protein
MEGGKGKKNRSINAPPNSLKDSNANPKVKKTKEKEVGVGFLTHNISGLRRVSLNYRMGTKNSDKRINYSHKPNKPNNKLVNE